MGITQLDSNEKYERAIEISNQLHYPDSRRLEIVKQYVLSGEICMAKGTQTSCEACMPLSETICRIATRIDSVK